MINQSKISVVLFLFIGFTSWSINNDNDIYKEFNGGRSMYSQEKLILRKDSSYLYSQWFHNDGTLLDSGSWDLIDTLLILNSYQPHITESKHFYSRKEKRKLKTKDSYYIKIDSTYQFTNDTFLYKKDRVYLFDFKELKDKYDSSFYLLYLTLYEKNN